MSLIKTNPIIAVGGSDTQVQFNSGGSAFGGDSGFTFNATTNIATITGGLITPKVYPSADSTTAFQINKADGSTNVLNVDTTNSMVGIGTTAPAVKLHIKDSTNELYSRIETTGVNSFVGLEFKNDGGAWIIGENSADDFLVTNGYGFGGTVYLKFFRTTGYTEFLAGNVGIGQSTPTGVLHLKAGTATASTAPLKFTAGTNLTTPEAGAVEWDGTNLYVTQTGGTRKTIAYV